MMVWAHYNVCSTIYWILSIVAEIVAQIDSANNLEILKLSGNSYGKDAAKAIGRALSKHKDLKKALWSDMFVSRLKTEIPDALVSVDNE